MRKRYKNKDPVLVKTDSEGEERDKKQETVSTKE